jgi:hypothetical protein
MQSQPNFVVAQSVTLQPISRRLNFGIIVSPLYVGFFLPEKNLSKKKTRMTRAFLRGLKVKRQDA